MIELPPPLVLSAPAILRPCEIERQNPRLFELYLELRGYDPDWLRLAIASMPGFRTPHVAYDAPGSVSKTATGAWSHTVPNFETSLVGTFIGAGAGGGGIANDGATPDGLAGGATTCTGGISAGGGNGGTNAVTFPSEQGVSGSGGVASGGTNTNGQAGGTVGNGTNKGGDAPGGGVGGAAPVSTDPQAGNAGSAAGGGGSGARYHMSIAKYGGGGGAGGRVGKTWLRGELIPGSSLSGLVGVGGLGGGVGVLTFPGGAGARGQADLVWT